MATCGRERLPEGRLAHLGVRDQKPEHPVRRDDAVEDVRHALLGDLAPLLRDIDGVFEFIVAEPAG